jgi:hypothetical protein
MAACVAQAEHYYDLQSFALIPKVSKKRKRKSPISNSKRVF